MIANMNNIQDYFEEVEHKSMEPISPYNNTVPGELNEWRLVDPGFEMYDSN